MTESELTPQQQKLTDALAKYSVPSSVKERPAFIKNFMYGEHKIGKTTLACSLTPRPLLYSCDNGWTALKDWPEIDEKVRVDECQSLKHFELFIRALVEDLPIYRDVDHVIIDPINKLVNMYIDWLQDNAIPSTQDARVQWTRKPGGPDKDFQPFTSAGVGDYAAVRNYFRKQLYPLFKIKKHVTLIAHVREPSFMDKQGTGIRAAVPGQTHAMIAQEVDLLSYMEADWPRQTVSFKPNGKEDAGSRFRNLHGQKINAPDLIKVYEKRALNV